MTDKQERVLRALRSRRYSKLRSLEHAELFPMKRVLRAEIEALSVVLDEEFHEWAKGKPKYGK